MITPLQKKPLKERLANVIKEWAEHEGITLSKRTPGMFVSLEIDEKPGTKNTSSIEWTASVITDKDIKEILTYSRITPEPRSILNEMLASGTREITTEMVEGLFENSLPENINDRYFFAMQKATNLNAVLIRLRLPYRVDSLRLGATAKSYRLRKVKLTQTDIIDSSKKIQVNVSAEIRVRGSRYSKD
jgi:hypothetical protein